MKKFSVSEFNEAVKTNQNFENIEKGTEFNVYKNDIIIGKVLVQRTNVIYLDFEEVPFDLFTNNDGVYSFVEIE